MKKLFILLIAVFGFALNAHAVGSVVESGPVLLDAESGIYTLTFTCTADAAAATFPATAISADMVTFFKGWHLYRLRINPGATAPTDNYDLTITEEGGDVLGAAGVDLSTTATQFRAPSIASAGASTGVGAVTMATTWTITLTGNAVNSATTEITLFFTK